MLIDNFSKGIVVIPTQGLGNRLRILASTYILSKMINRPMHVIWQPADDCNIELSSLFNMNDTYMNSLLNPMKITELEGKNYLFHGHIHMNTVINSIEFIEQKYDYLVIIGGHEFNRNDITFEDLHYLKHQFYSRLTFSDTITTLLKNYDYIYNSDYIGIHFRDFIAKYDGTDLESCKNNEINPIHFPINSPIVSYYKFLDKLKINIPVLVVSNNPDIVERLSEKYPNIMFLHKKTNSLDRDKSAGMIDSIIDFILLSKSKFILGSFYSSFSDEASYINYIPKIIPVSDTIYNNPTKIPPYHCLGFESISFNKNKIYGLNLNKHTLFNYFDMEPSS